MPYLSLILFKLVLESEPEIEVVGTALDGKTAIALIKFDLTVCYLKVLSKLVFRRFLTSARLSSDLGW